jgi:hypothetical protein
MIDIDTAKANVFRYLNMLRECCPKLKGYEYRGPGDFLLTHGQWYDPTQLRPEETPEGVPKTCFANAIMLNLLHPTWHYVEGYAVPLHTGLPVLHGWNVTPDRVMVDSTWRNTGVCYFGVEFSVGRAADAALNGEASVLDDWMRGSEFLKQPWAGEDWERAWPEHDLMKVARRMASLRVCTLGYWIPPGRLQEKEAPQHSVAGPSVEKQV